MSKVESLLVSSIVIPYDRPPPDTATVAALKVSMAEVGLLNPILIQRYHSTSRCFLVAGHHRLQAAEELGWDTIDVIELPALNEGEDAATVARLTEVAENLHRREITALERDELVLRWAELVEERKKGQTAQPAHPVLSDGRKAGPQHGGRGISQTARELSMSRDDVRRAMRVGKLSPEAKQAARDHGLANNRAALLEAAREAVPTKQVAVIEQRAAPKPKPRPSSALRNLRAAWAVASADEQAAFLAEVLQRQ